MTQPLIEAFAGNTVAIQVSVKKPDGTAYDLTDALAIDYALAVTPAGPALLTKTVGSGIAVIGPATDGVLEVTLDADDTADLSGLYYHEVRVTDQFETVLTCYAASIEFQPTLIP